MCARWKKGCRRIKWDMHVVKGTSQAVQLICSRCANCTDKQSEHWVFHPQNSSQLASAWKPLLLCSRLGAIAFPPLCLVFKPAHRQLLSPQLPIQPRLTVKTRCHSEKQGDGCSEFAGRTHALSGKTNLLATAMLFLARCGSYCKAFPPGLLNRVL